MFSQPEKNIEQFHVDPGMIVADLGSGSGFYSLALAKNVGPSGKVYAIDVQKDLLSRLEQGAKQEGYLNIELIWGDLDEVGGSTLKDSVADRVVVANILFQLEEKDNFLSEVKRILKPNGTILVVDWSDSFSGLGPVEEQVVKQGVARVLFEDAGLKFVREINAGDHHYGMVFKR